MLIYLNPVMISNLSQLVQPSLKLSKLFLLLGLKLLALLKLLFQITYLFL